MKFLNPFLPWLGLGALSNPDKGHQRASTHSVSTQAGINVTDEQAMQLSGVWASVQLIAPSVTSLPIKFYNETASGRVPITGRHEVADIINGRPNPWMKPRDFRLCMTTQMALFNNAYAEKLYSGDRLVGLVPLRPGRMTPYIDDNNELTFHYKVREGIKVFSQKSIMHLKGFGTDGSSGSGAL